MKTVEYERCEKCERTVNEAREKAGLQPIEGGDAAMTAGDGRVKVDNRRWKLGVDYAEDKDRTVYRSRFKCLDCEGQMVKEWDGKRTPEITSCTHCKGGVAVELYKYSMFERYKKTTKSAGELKIDVNVDVSDAMKGLKALERQAKKTARALKKVDSLAASELTEQELIKELESLGWEVEETIVSDKCNVPVLGQTVASKARNYN